MEIPLSVQNKLKCNECDEFLSCGPIYLLPETAETICGRCSQQSEEDNQEKNINRTRIIPYEAVASLLVFPCAFATHGCPEKLPFSLGQPPHESVCKFRPFICPIAPRGSCEWIGSWSKLKQHCQDKHSANISANPCNPPRPDLSISNLQIYLISAFNFLFLLHIKVCVTSGKLFHSIQMIGNSKFYDKFSYLLQIKGNGSKITKEGSVLRAGILMQQEPVANCILINSLLDVLGGEYGESEFTITIQTSIIFNCVNCLKNIENISDSKYCEECLEQLTKCEFNDIGCSFVEVYSDKCIKHNRYFCKYRKNCCLCGVNFTNGTFIEHLGSPGSCRKTVRSNIDSVVCLIPNANFKYYFVLLSSNNIGTIICEYFLFDSKLLLYLRTSLPSHEWKNYKCKIELTDPQTKYSQIITPDVRYDDWNDWFINEVVDNFPSWQNIGINMKIYLNNI